MWSQLSWLHRTWRQGSYRLTSTIYWCKASKLKSRWLIYGVNETFFVGGFVIFRSVLLWRYHSDKKPTGYWRYYHIQDVGHLAVMGPGVHTMSDELILQISCNMFLAFMWILMMTSGQNISHYTTAKLSINVWNHDLISWQNKIDTQKHFCKTTITSTWTLSKRKIPITIVKAQVPSNPNQKSRTRDNNGGMLVLRAAL